MITVKCWCRECNEELEIELKTTITGDIEFVVELCETCTDNLESFSVDVEEELKTKPKGRRKI